MATNRPSAGPCSGEGHQPHYPVRQNALWTLYVQLEKGYSAAFKWIMEDDGLTVMERKVLLALDNDPCLRTAADLVRTHKMAKSHVSLAVNSLTEKGYLTQDAGVGKSIYLRLTPMALELIQRDRRHMQGFHDLVYQGFSLEEMDQVLGFFTRIAENLKGAQEKNYGKGNSKE